MKSIIPALLTAATAMIAVSQKPITEQAPPGSAEKILTALPSRPFATPEKKRNLLVFSRTNGFRHASIATGKIALEEMGKKTGAFETTISDDLSNFESENLSKFDAVCFLSTTLDVFSPHPKELEKLNEQEKFEAKVRTERLKKNLMSFIRSGRGFVGIHAATDTFYDWPEYGKMINGYFDGHPWTAGTDVSIKVESGQEKHPLVAMFEGRNLEFKEEIYQLKEPYDSKAVHMLLRLDTEKTDMTIPGIKRKDNDFGVAWARRCGDGRVFYCSLGHNHEIYWHPAVLGHYLAGIQWAIGDFKVDLPNGVSY